MVEGNGGRQRQKGMVQNGMAEGTRVHIFMCPIASCVPTLALGQVGVLMAVAKRRDRDARLPLFVAQREELVRDPK